VVATTVRVGVVDPQVAEALLDPGSGRHRPYLGPKDARIRASFPFGRS
jgi:hypothetical protein